MKKTTITIILGILMLATAGSALAAEVVAPNPQDPNLIIGSTENHKNLYTAGGNLTINGNTLGDLAAGGGVITVDGDVQNELLLVGGTLNVSGNIGGTARMAGGSISITGPVGGDLVIAGGNVTITGKSEIDGDLLVAGGNVIIDAPVKGQVRIAAADVTINSKIGGDVHVQSSKSLTFGSQADVHGTVYHKGSTKALVQDGAHIGTMNYTQWQPRSGRAAIAGLLTAAFLLKILAMLLVAWLFVHFKKSWVLQAVGNVQAHPWSSLGWGLVYFIAFPLAAILLLFTIVGYYAAFITGAVFVLLLLLARVLTSLVIGYVIVRLLSKPTDGIPVWQPIIIGVVITELLGFIPFVGWVVLLVVFLQSLASLVMAAFGTLKDKGEGGQVL